MVAMHHKIAWPHLVGVDGAAGCLASTPHVTTGTEALLPEEFPVGHQRDPPGWQLQSLQFCSSPHFQSNGGVLLNQSGDGVGVSRIRHKSADAVVFLQQGNGTTRLCGNQPNGSPFGLKTLDQFSELSELIGIRRYRSTGEVKAIGVVIDFE